uniref:Transposable element n=1 Tax=Oryza sativa subsp. japonica TaxID=39947 RepID=Q94HN2_ORYSJ|nr:Putative transposable element [Oryza sativa Japonica Group]
MDLEWITTADRDSVEYFRGVTALVAAATSTNSVDALEYIWCPCHNCKKDRQLPAQRVHSHLLTKGFMDNFLGEEEQGEGSAGNCHGHDADVGYKEEDQTCVDHGEPNLDQMLRDGERFDTDDKEYHKFTTMVKDSKTPIYNGCKAEHSKLQVVLSLLHLKASNGWSDKSFTELLELLKEILPTDNVLPESTYQAKKVICPLGLDIQKIHACLNDCILYRGEFAYLEQCPVCKASRYKCGDGDDEGGNKKRVQVKVVWYFPIIPRLERMYANKKHAKLMRWHHEERKKDGMIRHPADGSQWRKIDRKYQKEFSHDIGNVRIALSTDGMNPFGPTQPGNDIDVYFKPLVEDLHTLWTEGMRMWDAYKREHFICRAILLGKITDYPALGNTSGQTVKGMKACVRCMAQTGGKWLNHCRKTMYMRHRRFLRQDHPYHRNKNAFDGTVEMDGCPIFRTGSEILAEVKDLRVVFGKGSGSTCASTSSGETPLFKKKSVSWDLPYWEDLDIRHAIDVMHVEKNVCEGVLGVSLNTPGKMKDVTS